MEQDLLKDLPTMMKSTIMEVLGIEITHLEKGIVKGKMPVDERTHQPYGLLHGGATAVLLETLGSFGSHFIVAPDNKAAVGIEVSVTHLKGVRSGHVYATAEAIHLGRKIHHWKCDILDDKETLIASGKLSVMIIEKP